ncbi:calcium/sodium antiporter [Petroclostridium sp. X23]|uniref:calcium/sodium antiporter n=1 Tax=Petroclostridium sp. X23 TaxID=3045146 RepID=UPI0024ADAD6C|nr:calcium/sodium antiporter [Petroclostridium sp. X23]WHH57045.1 calcium/sodium antiporter [Petroclostridium sp. X23]
MNTLPYILFAIGLIFIVKGGDWFIESASWIAKITGIPEVLIGATIVSLGTTLPELMVSSTSAIQGHGEMAIGNAIGSTICNIGLILGLSNLISPSRISSRTYNIKAVLMVLYCIIFLIISLDGKISGIDSSILLTCLLFYIILNYLEVYNLDTLLSKKSHRRTNKSNIVSITVKELSINMLQFFLGSGLVFFGAQLVVKYGVIIAALLKVPDMFISLTAIALGTSLPELVTSVTALIKGHRNLSVGNIIGANILNISMVLGVSSLFTPIDIPIQTLRLDIPFSLLLMLTLVIPSILTWKIKRLHASILLIQYIAYLSILTYLFL